MMITCLMRGRYSANSLLEISTDRTKQAVAQIHEQGGDVRSMYTLLGDDDVIFIADFPEISNAIKTSVLLSRYLGISFSTYPAIPVEEFDAMMEDM